MMVLLPATAVIVGLTVLIAGPKKRVLEVVLACIWMPLLLLILISCGGHALERILAGGRAADFFSDGSSWVTLILLIGCGLIVLERPRYRLPMAVAAGLFIAGMVAAGVHYASHGKCDVRQEDIPGEYAGYYESEAGQQHVPFRLRITHDNRFMFEERAGDSILHTCTAGSAIPHRQILPDLAGSGTSRSPHPDQRSHPVPGTVFLYFVFASPKFGNVFSAKDPEQAMECRVRCWLRRVMVSSPLRGVAEPWHGPWSWFGDACCQAALHDRCSDAILRLLTIIELYQADRHDKTPPIS